MTTLKQIKSDQDTLQEVCTAIITCRHESGNLAISEKGLKEAGEVFVREVNDKFRTVPMVLIKQAIETGMKQTTLIGKLTPELMLTWVKQHVLAPRLTPEQQLNVMAAMSTPVNDMTIKQLALALSGFIAAAIADTGQKFDSEGGDMATMAQRLARDLKIKEPKMTIGQVEIAFQNGTLEEYGTNYGMNKVTFWKWIQGFLWHNKRNQALALQRNYIESLLKPKSLPETPQQRITRMKEYIIAAYKEFEGKGHYPDMFNLVYKYLDELKIIHYTREQKKEFTALAVESVKKNEQKKIASENDIRQQRKMMKALKDLTRDADPVKDEAMRLALNHYFKQVKKGERTIEEILNQNQL